MSIQWRKGKRIAIVGGGPGAISTALACLKQGYDVRVYERQKTCEPFGGAVLLSVPVLAVLRSYGIDIDNFGAPTVTYFKNDKGLERAKLPFNPKIEKRLGIKGWHYGVLRSTAFEKMLSKIPQGVVHTSHQFDSYTEYDDTIELNFSNGTKVEADILVGADGIRSNVSKQAFGDPQLFHIGIRLWLAWCDHIPDIPPNYGYISHNWQYQASFFPMIHNGKPGFEWWVVEPSWEGKPVPRDVKAHLQGILKDWADPMPRFLECTDFDTQVYRWEIYNRPSMKKWSKGRVVCVGDAVHPVSPYAAYGMGMAIEDGYFLANALRGVDLVDIHAVNAGFELYEKQRVGYVNHNMEFARYMGRIFHGLPWPLAWLRDLVFNYTPFLKYTLEKGYLEGSEKETLALKDLYQDKSSA
ncbi:unnamed protein product [Periconia digitata]|uniref:FAD-binding domain-containing protein n=1 Tax=Periconia digitata TaxID=1303443 RepID=A0A9W4UHD1_9PLEO|nr:unnamed protein product [Periconia digitata]